MSTDCDYMISRIRSRTLSEKKKKGWNWTYILEAVVYSLYGSSLVHCHLTDGNDELVSWCFEPSQPQRITSGLGNDDEVFLSSITNYNEMLFSKQH